MLKKIGMIVGVMSMLVVSNTGWACIGADRVEFIKQGTEISIAQLINYHYTSKNIAGRDVYFNLPPYIEVTDSNYSLVKVDVLTIEDPTVRQAVCQREINAYANSIEENSILETLKDKTLFKTATKWTSNAELKNYVVFPMELMKPEPVKIQDVSGIIPTTSDVIPCHYEIPLYIVYVTVQDKNKVETTFSVSDVNLYEYQPVAKSIGTCQQVVYSN